MIELNQRAEAVLRQTVARLSDGDNLTNICPSQWRGSRCRRRRRCATLSRSRALVFPGFFGDSDVTRENVALLYRPLDGKTVSSPL